MKPELTELQLRSSAGRRPGPRPALYIIIRVIGCRIHHLAITGGWASYIDPYTRHWPSEERELAYQFAQRAGGLLVRMTEAEWAAALDAANRGDNKENTVRKDDQCPS